MPELPGRIDGEIVYADHMNEAQIRAVQRYDTEAIRDTLNPAPETGQPAWIVDVAELQIWDGTAWKVASGDGVFLPLSGGTLTGPLYINSGLTINSLGIAYSGATHPGGGVNNIGFRWGGITPGKVSAVIDNVESYAIADNADLGNYLPLTGGSLSGRLYINDGMSVNSAGIDYPGADHGGGAASAIGFRWSGGRFIAVVNNTTSQELAFTGDLVTLQGDISTLQGQVNSLNTDMNYVLGNCCP